MKGNKHTYLAFSSRSIAVLVCLIILISCHGNAQSKDNPVSRARLLTLEAGQAYDRKDYQKAFDFFSQAHQLRPDHPGIMYNLAACDALLLRESRAVRMLADIAAMRLVYHPEKDSDFVSIWRTQKFQAVLHRFQSNESPEGVAQRAFQLGDSDLIAEGMAYSENRHEFYVSSVRKRKILCIKSTGEESDSSLPNDSLWSVMGMAVDQKRQILWAATSALGQMEGFREDLRGRAAIVKYDLRKGTLVGRWEVSPVGTGHTVGDLTLDNAGDVYATDSQAPNIYRLTSDGKFELYLTSNQFVSLQGIAWSKDNKLLYVSDYARGVFVIDPKRKRVHLMAPLRNETLLSIDGLYWYDGTLIATQNDISPNRVVRLYLAPGGKSFNRLTVLEANRPFANEPSLGVVANKEFYFIGNSQWSKFDNNGRKYSKDVVEPYTIFSTRLQ